MKLKILILLSFCSVFAWKAEANSPKYDLTSNYAKIVDASQLIVRFNENINEETSRAVLADFEMLQKHILFLPAPKIAVVQTKTKDSVSAYFSLIEALENIPTIEYVGLYMQNDQGFSFGILDKVFVKLKNEVDLNDLENTIHQSGISVPKSYKFNPSIYEFQVNKSANVHPLALAMELIALGKYEFVEPNYLLNPLVHSTDPLLYRQWSLENDGSVDQWEGTPGADMSVLDAWTITKGDPTILVAVMDSGVDTSHADLYGRMRTGYDAFGQGTKGYPMPRFRSDGHGTSCAGIIAANNENGHGISGVAPNSQLVSSRIFYYADTTFLGIGLGVIPFSTSEALANGINWAWQVANADIQSHSWSLPDLFIAIGFPEGNPALVDDGLQQAFEQGRDGKGCLLFFSSGNEGNAPNWPGRDAHSMTVNATSMCDEAKTPTSCDSLDWTGNWGANLDFGAPGVSVTTLDMRDTFGFSNGDYILRFGGTSASCPNAVGVAALMLSANPNFLATSYRELLSRSCDKVGGYAYSTWMPYGSWSAELGYGRINAYEAVLATLNFTATNEIEYGGNPVKIWPNPVSEQLYFDFGEQSIAEIQIYATDGK